MAITIDPIGYVQVDGDEFTITLEEAYRPALAELDEFSHINVLWWCHYLDDPQFRQMTVGAKPYRDGPSEVGVFATRSPVRPNPIAVTVSGLVSIDHESGVIGLTYIDAEDGTPVVDIKPYLPATDRVREVRTPEWCSGWPQWLEDSATFDWASVFENAQ